MSKATAKSTGIRTIEFEGEHYPLFQTEGFASQYAFPFALKVCQGVGFDVGCMKTEWALPGAIPIDKILPDEWDAMNLPPFMVDFVFSSHCAEHLLDWVTVLDYWLSRIKAGGTIFLYLPHYSQRYWRCWSNRKHYNTFTPQIIRDYLEARKCENIFVGERDLYHSFMAMATVTKNVTAYSGMDNYLKKVGGEKL